MKVFGVNMLVQRPALPQLAFIPTQDELLVAIKYPVPGYGFPLVICGGETCVHGKNAREMMDGGESPHIVFDVKDIVGDEPTWVSVWGDLDAYGPPDEIRQSAVARNGVELQSWQFVIRAWRIDRIECPYDEE